MPNYFMEDQIQKVMSGTLKLETEFECGHWVHSTVGAGILCDWEGHILTNAHIVSDYFTLGTFKDYSVCGEVVAKFQGGEKCAAEVLSVDFGNDLALLKISKRVIKPHNIPCVFSKDVPHRGADFFVVGHPNGIVPFNVKFGRVSDPSRLPSDIPQNILNGFPHSLEHMDPAMKFLELDVDAAPGFSGGPLSTVDGLVFGVLHTEIKGTARYGIPVDIVESVFERMVNRSLEGKNVFCHLN